MKTSTNFKQSILTKDEAILNFTSKLHDMVMHAVKFQINEIFCQEANGGVK